MGLPQASEGHIYFIEAEGLDRLKIGFSTNLEKRLSVLAHASPVPLKTLKTVRGSLQMEQVILAVFDKYRVHGEWFQFHETLKRFVASLEDGQVFSPEMIFGDSQKSI